MNPEEAGASPVDHPTRVARLPPGRHIPGPPGSTPGRATDEGLSASPHDKPGANRHPTPRWAQSPHNELSACHPVDLA